MALSKSVVYDEKVAESITKDAQVLLSVLQGLLLENEEINDNDGFILDTNTI